MKKLFFFFAAMLLAITASAKVVNITPTSPRSTDNIRYAIRDSLTADTIVLADGTYAETYTVELNRNIVVMAANGAKPIVRLATAAYIKVTNSANFVIQGIKFDGATNSTETAIRAYDATATKIRIEDCEFYGFVKNIITGSESTHADSVFVNNCYFHDNTGRAAIYFPASNVENQQSCLGLVVTNSTFANNNIPSYEVGLIDIRNRAAAIEPNQKLRVDHCTFYNNTTKNFDYADIKSYKSTDVIVSNCIFNGPSASYDGRATHFYGGQVKNCLTINYVHDDAGHRDDGATFKDTILNRDPLFFDPANGDYTLGAGSPALTAGTDGKAIGDPRWHPSVATYHDFEIDLRSGQLGTEGSNLQKYLAIDGETYNYSDAAPKEYNAILNAASYNGSQHGYVNLVATIPVEAGNYKLTLGACGYGSGAGTVKNADLSETLASFNQQIEANNKCYHQNTTENIVTATFKVSAAQTIRITCGNYTPYIKLEKLEAQEFTVTFAAEGAEGSIPAARNVVDGEKLTLPVNRTLYKDGYTLTGWSDGENTYSTEFTPTEDVTLTAVFTANAKGLLNAQTETIVKWYFGESNGCPTMHLEGGAGNGFVVAQATVDGESQDVKLAIDATSGKFYNKNRGDKWAQVNANTVFIFPSKKDITVVIEANSGAADYTLDGGTLTANANDYYSYLQVTYPKSQATAIDNTNANAKAVKSIVNGQLLITRDGKTYNVLGTMVK